jgi:hypothetical protein
MLLVICVSQLSVYFGRLPHEVNKVGTAIATEDNATVVAIKDFFIFFIFNSFLYLLDVILKYIHAVPVPMSKFSSELLSGSI